MYRLSHSNFHCVIYYFAPDEARQEVEEPTFTNQIAASGEKVDQIYGALKSLSAPPFTCIFRHQYLPWHCRCPPQIYAQQSEVD